MRWRHLSWFCFDFSLCRRTPLLFRLLSLLFSQEPISRDRLKRRSSFNKASVTSVVTIERFPFVSLALSQMRKKNLPFIFPMRSHVFSTITFSSMMSKIIGMSYSLLLMRISQFWMVKLSTFPIVHISVMMVVSLMLMTSRLLQQIKMLCISLMLNVRVVKHHVRWRLRRLRFDSWIFGKSKCVKCKEAALQKKPSIGK